MDNQTNNHRQYTHNGIYMMQFTKCDLDYIGKTGQQLKMRMQAHNRNIKNKEETSVALHFTPGNHNPHDLEICFIQSDFRTDKENKNGISLY